MVGFGEVTILKQVKDRFWRFGMTLDKFWKWEASFFVQSGYRTEGGLRCDGGWVKWGVGLPDVQGCDPKYRDKAAGALIVAMQLGI